MLEQIKERLYQEYEINEEYSDGERGCYVNGNWLSINRILEILKEEL